ncbi:MAG TPA: helix-turn-helix domain-containing protein [Thermoplasmata archaeon]|nr:helix-turn-helix domain-containing protein [Thermoplasmata archaeon]
MTPRGPEKRDPKAASRRAHPQRSHPVRLAVYRIAVLLPAGSIGRDFPLAHPELRIEITNRMDLEPERLLSEVRVTGPHAGDYLEEVLEFPEVTHAEVHAESPRSAVYRFTQVTPVVQRVIQHHRVLTRYPILAENGWLRFETVAEAAQVRAVVDDLRRRVGESQVEAVRQGPFSGRRLGLSPAQSAVFQEALSGGYFTHPRGISVSRLATRLGRSKSTVSVALAKIQARLVAAAIRGESLEPPSGG